MNLTHRGKTFFAICLLSLLFSYLIVNINYFPYFGISLTLLIFVIFTYKSKKIKREDSRLYLIFTLLFSALISIRSEGFVTFLNITASIFFGSLMLISGTKYGSGFIDHLFSPVVLIFRSIFTKSEYYLDLNRTKGEKPTRDNADSVVGVILTFILMLIVIPILASVNPFFQKLVENTWNYFNLVNIFKDLGYETVFIWCLRLVFFFVFLLIIPKLITLIQKTNDLRIPLRLGLLKLSLTLPKFALAGILAVFFVTQYQFYFATPEILSSMGLTYSQRAREVFGQLTVVSGIVLWILYNSRIANKWSKFLSVVLGIEGVFLTIMAYISAFDYINAWGFTYIRLYGVAFATWMLGIFILFFRTHKFGDQDPQNNFVKNTIILSGAVLLLINVFNFDYLIYHFKKASTGEGPDYTYLSHLAADSRSSKDQFTKLKEAANKRPGEANYDNKNPYVILYKIENLQTKYKKFDLRTFNLIDYIEYKDIKDIDTTEVRSIYEKRIQY